MDFHLPGWNGKCEDRAGRRIVGYGDLAAMGSDDRIAKTKTKSQASAAVSNGIAAAVEHLEDLFLFAVRNTGAVISNGDLGVLLVLLCGDGNV